MHALITEMAYPDDKPIANTSEFQQFQREHADLTGYLGTLMVDAGAGRHLTLTLWQTADDMSAAREAMGPIRQRTLYKLTTSPIKLLGAGPVTVSELPG